MHATTPRRRRALLTVLAGLLLALVGAPAAHACSCVGYDCGEAVEAAELIADVTVERAVGDDEGEVTYLVAVDAVWKGEETRTILLRTHEQTAACGLGRIPDGERLLLWGSGADGEYSTTWCALPMDGGPDDRERLTAQLGEPADLTAQPVVVPEGAEPARGLAARVGGAAALGALLGLGALGAATAVAVLVRARRGRD
jgi:hypothetical protein